MTICASPSDGSVLSHSSRHSRRRRFPAKQINTSSRHVTGSFKDANKIKELARHVDYLSVEIEHVDALTLAEIDMTGVSVTDDAGKTSTKKAHFEKAGIPVAQQIKLDAGDIQKALAQAGKRFGYPFIVKSRNNSYDGRGNVVVDSEEDFDDAIDALGKDGLYAEKMVKFVKELAVMVIRTEDKGASRTYPYPAVETVHQDSICSTVYMPPRGVPQKICHQAQELASKVIGTLWGRGVFAVEMFLTADAHPRAPSAIMVNILGGAQPQDYQRLVDLCESTYDDDMDVHLHLYGKDSKPSRKIGHITLTGTGSIEELEKKAAAFVALANTIRDERIAAASEQLRPQQGGAATPAPPAVVVSKTAQVLVTMGSDSDLPVLKAGLDILKDFGVPSEVRITSAHRTPNLMTDVAEAAAARGIKPPTLLPVIGVPVKATHLDGQDSLYSIVQMPRGIPVATVGINNSTNAALLAIRILGAHYPEYQEKMSAYMKKMETEVHGKAARLLDIGYEAYLAGMPKK
ncbi:unnamed protein product [Parascedosporium putredinis]|uniref:Phosphoribosylaminoimidazole carboxylase n=1 Tax=Parascedosporium putredinis TaxID=1442378 RepID=A0A9P1MEF3_9PEZI|nr:unnamed protein product [Parascedosporium putredinis]CAI8002540.1 unnamed protein product [Parascedosporium putredinis]